MKRGERKQWSEEARLRDSIRLMYNGTYKSAIMQHAADTGHSFRESDVRTLDNDSNWRSRGVRESIYIRALNPPLNRQSDRNDRYTLPAHFDSILKNTIKAPPPPLPHNNTEKKTFTGDRLPGRPKKRAEMTVPQPQPQPQPQPHPSHQITTRWRARASEGATGTT